MFGKITVGLKNFFVLSFLRSAIVLAVLATSLTIPNTGLANESELREGPCNKILEICKAHVKASSKKISLYRDCMQPLLNNEKVADLKVDSAVLKACQEKKAEIKQKKQ